MIGELDTGRAAAAAGQSGLMALYDNLFSVMDLQSAQVLVTSNDFTEKGFKDNLCATVEDLLSMNVVSGLALPLGHTREVIERVPSPEDYELWSLLESLPNLPGACVSQLSGILSAS